MTEQLKAPFVWFGGKRRVASEVWTALGDVDNYVEPFAGSLAVLLGRPQTHRRHLTGAETTNDADQFLSNFWRALALHPEETAKWCDWPVNEACLFSRHLWLVNTGRERIAAMDDDPDFCDPKVAGWWVWGLNAWIGAGWCSGKGPHKHSETSKLPHLSDAGRGVNRKLPHLSDAGRGVNRKLPHLGNPGRGVNRKLPHLGDAGVGVNAARGDDITDYFQALATRLRRVRVCCGDWARVVTNGATSHGDRVGVFLDPPYLGDVRTSDLYSVDDHTISHAVREWALSKGDDPRFRIVLAGYVEEHDHLIPDTWRRVAYSANAAYNSHAGGGKNKQNRHNERLWMSPHCLGKGLL